MPRAGESIEEWTIEPMSYGTKTVVPTKPKRAKTPYMIWKSENFSKIKKNLGDRATIHTIAKYCQRQWKQLVQTDKDRYGVKAYDDYNRYNSEYLTFVTKIGYNSAPAPGRRVPLSRAASAVNVAARAARVAAAATGVLPTAKNQHQHQVVASLCPGTQQPARAAAQEPVPVPAPAPVQKLESHEESDEEEDLVVDEIEIDLKIYYKTEDGTLYDPETSECVGRYVGGEIVEE